MNKTNDYFTIAGRQFSSRLLVGTGRYDSLAQTREVVEASGAEIITVALRRVNLAEKNGESLQDYLSPEQYTYLPNTAGCYTAEEAVRTLRLAKAASGWNLAKLEVIGDKTTLYPDMIETIKAAEILVKEGFDLMVYCTDDPIFAKRLENIGVAAIMPLAAPIGSGLGIQNPLNIKLIVEQSNIPVLVDAGVGTASDAAIAMELGCDGVLMNTAIAEADNPVIMARAMKLAVEAGRLAHLAGRMPKREYAKASSPLSGVI
jgi:thiazole synthase